MRAARWAACIGVFAIGAVAAGSDPAVAHAFPDRAEPGAGAKLRVAPTQVRIWFDGNIEPAFSRLRVTSQGGQGVDRGDGHVDPQNHRLLTVTLPLLPPGPYRVLWSVLAVDGHRTEGDYTFTILPSE